MILDTVAGLNELCLLLGSFLATAQRFIRCSADVSGTATPYAQLLAALEVEKGNGPIDVSVTDQGTLRIGGSSENLSVYAKHFSFRDDEEGSHHHPEHVSRSDYIRPGTLSVVIEADTARIEELASGS